MDLYGWSGNYDWVSVSKQLLQVASFYNLATFGIILTAHIKVKAWINSVFLGDRRWRCSVEGLFLIYLVLLLMLSLSELLIMIWLFNTDYKEFYLQLAKNWKVQLDNNYFQFFTAIMIYASLNFGMTVFVLHMLERMSHANWSEKLNESTESRQTSQMDREVAAGWFDLMLLDTDFEFRNFTHNIPPTSESHSRNSSSTFYAFMYSSGRVKSDGRCESGLVHLDTEVSN